MNWVSSVEELGDAVSRLVNSRFKVPDGGTGLEYPRNCEKAGWLQYRHWERSTLGCASYCAALCSQAPHLKQFQSLPNIFSSQINVFQISLMISITWDTCWFQLPKFLEIWFHGTMIGPWNLYFYFLLFLDFVYLFLERGEGREKKRERNISAWLLLTHPLLGTWPRPTTQACALTGNQTSNHLFQRPALNPLPGLEFVLLKP